MLTVTSAPVHVPPDLLSIHTALAHYGSRVSRMSPAPAARDPPLAFCGMTCRLDLRTPVVIPIGCPATSVCYPLESSRIAGTQNVATSTLLLMPSRLLRSTSVHCKVSPYAFAWLPSCTRLLHLCRAVRSAPRTMLVCRPAICHNPGTSSVPRVMPSWHRFRFFRTVLKFLSFPRSPTAPVPTRWT